VNTLVMAKAPRPGFVKTRLAPLLGDAGCARLQSWLIGHAARWADEAGRAHVAVAPADAEAEVRPLVPAGVTLLAQSGGDLGLRLAAATEQVSAPVLVIGTDCPVLGPDHAREATAALDAGADACLGPATDGGYWLVGLARPAPALFDIGTEHWGGPEVLERTLACAERAGLRVTLLREECDLDEPDDVPALLADPRTPADLAALLRAAA
jgi:uncharacterized protein